MVLLYSSTYLLIYTIRFSCRYHFCIFDWMQIQTNFLDDVTMWYYEIINKWSRFLSLINHNKEKIFFFFFTKEGEDPEEREIILFISWYVTLKRDVFCIQILFILDLTLMRKVYGEQARP
jgi:hypothetical protein